MQLVEWIMCGNGMTQVAQIHKRANEIERGQAKCSAIQVKFQMSRKRSCNFIVIYNGFTKHEFELYIEFRCNYNGCPL